MSSARAAIAPASDPAHPPRLPFVVRALLALGTGLVVGAGALGLLSALPAGRRSAGASAVVALLGVAVGWYVAGRLGRQRPVAGTDAPALAPAPVDPVTGLAGRATAVEALRRRPAGRDRNGVAVGFLRVDGLDQINRRLGRRVGDAVLCAIAERLGAAVPEETVVRLGASTFAVVRPHADAPEAWAGRLAGVTDEAMAFGSVTVHATGACVVVRTDGFHHDPSLLLDEAEQVARPHLRGSRARYEVVDLELASPGAAASPAAAARLAGAVADGAIVADYQPIVDLRSMQVVGVEALARWRGAAPGDEAPEDFLELARSLGLGATILDGILRQVAADFATGEAARRDWWVSVNLSTQDCTDPTLPGRVERVLREAGLEPGRLVLEVSERAIPDPGVVRALRHLAELGVRLAIDDFGSGWSSLAQLRSLPLSLLKLDRTLVVDPSVQDAQLTMATVAMAGALGVPTLAEGIEHGEDLLLLCLAECNYGQGFWWSEATTLDEVLARFPEPTDEPDAAVAPVIDMQLVREAAARGPGSAGDGPEVADLLEAALRAYGEDHEDPLVAYLEDQLASGRSHPASARSHPASPDRPLAVVEVVGDADGQSVERAGGASAGAEPQSVGESEVANASVPPSASSR